MQYLVSTGWVVVLIYLQTEQTKKLPYLTATFISFVRFIIKRKEEIHDSNLSFLLALTLFRL
jgi:hypothetical protein